MKLLVTGLSGLVGSRFKELYGHQFEFENLDLTAGIDITNPQQIDQAIGKSNADTIIHLAAFTNVSAAYEETGKEDGPCYKVNVIGTQNICEAATKYHKYLIHVSTDYVFDGTKKTPYLETDTPNPIEWYGQTKYQAELAVQQSGCKHVILRLSFPYQAKPSRPDFLAKIIDNLSKNTLPPPFIDHIVTPTFVDDIAKIFTYCVNNEPIGIFHAVGSSSHTDYDISLMVKNIFSLTQGDIKPGYLENYLKMIQRPYQQTMIVSNQKLIRDFDIKPLTFAEGLQAISTQMK